MATLPSSEAVAAEPPLPPSTRARLWRVARFVIGIIIGALAIYAVSGKSDELSGASQYLDHLHWGWAVGAVLAEMASYLAFAVMQQRLLGAGKVRVAIRPMTGIALAGNVLQTSLPGGVIVSAAWSFRQFRRYGADDVLAAWVLVAMTAVSIASLSGLAAIGLAMAASTGSALGLVSTIIGLVIAIAAVIVLWTRRMWLVGHAGTVLRLCQRVTRRPRGDPHLLVAEAVERLAAISPTRVDWAWAIGWAAANWIFDMGCLMLAFSAVGVDVPWRGVLLAYAAAQLATNLPVTPGGLGVVEGSLTVALVAFGGGQASTVAAVLIYRVLSFWAILPIGWGSLGAITFLNRRADRHHPLSLEAG